MTDGGIEAELAGIEATLEGGVLGVAARFLPTGRMLLYQADEVFPTASCIKIAIVEALHRQAAAGALDLAQRVRIAAEDRVGGSGVLGALAPGADLPLADLATLAIAVSDNTASNLCLRAAGGPAALNGWLGRWGLTETRIHRPIRFQLSPDDPPHTATGTPREFLRLLECLTEPTTSRMGQVSDTAMLPRYLGVNPYAQDLRAESPPYTVRHKPGAVSGVRNDVGWVEREGRTLALALFTRGCPDPRWTVDNAGCLAVARAARRLTDFFFEET